MTATRAARPPIAASRACESAGPAGRSIRDVIAGMIGAGHDQSLTSISTPQVGGSFTKAEKLLKSIAPSMETSFVMLRPKAAIS